MQRRLIAAIPSAIQGMGQGEVHDSGIILPKFQGDRFVDFCRFVPHPPCGRGRGRGTHGRTEHLRSKGFRAGTVWQFWVVGYRHCALARDELLRPMGERRLRIGQMSIYLLAFALSRARGSKLCA